MPAEKAVFTIAQLAERWGTSGGYVRNLILNEELPAFSLGKLWRIRYDDVLAYEATEPTKTLTPCDVYLIRCGEYVKIGKATSVEKRLAKLQNANPHPLEVLHVLTEGDGHALERDLHARFASLRIHGEWFRLEGDLLAYIEELRGERDA